MKHSDILYGCFAFGMLGLAVYYSTLAIHSWNQSPIVAAVQTERVNQIDFPAISVCHTLTWTWPSLVSLFSYFDPDGKSVRTLMPNNLQIREFTDILDFKNTKCLMEMQNFTFKHSLQELLNSEMIHEKNLTDIGL